MGILYLVATPIGNLEDITTRALRILTEVRLVAAEDTRQTGKLLHHFGIHTPLTSYFEHNKLQKLELILSELERGDVALVSDAGMPGLNDPGYELVRAVIQAGWTVSPVPGASAPVAALVASGLPTDAFLYLGYLPRKAGERQRKLVEVADLPYTLVLLEAPHRLLDSLLALQEVLGNRQAAAARELTKLHEEIYRGPLSELISHFTVLPPRGELTLVIAGNEGDSTAWDEQRLRQEIQTRLQAGEPASSVAGTLARQSGWSRRKVYEMTLQRSNQVKP